MISIRHSCARRLLCCSEAYGIAADRGGAEVIQAFKHDVSPLLAEFSAVGAVHRMTLKSTSLNLNKDSRQCP